MFDSFKAEVQLNDLHNLDKLLQSLGQIGQIMLHYMQSGDQVAEATGTAAGTAGMFTGGWALGSDEKRQDSA